MLGAIEQSSNLLLVFTKTVVLSFGPYRDPLQFFNLFPEPLTTYDAMLPFRREERLATTVDYLQRGIIELGSLNLWNVIVLFLSDWNFINYYV
jgi:hypothetical protein